MNRALELDLWNAVAGKVCLAADWIDLALEAGAISSAKEALATLAKWSREGCYDYSVVLDCGWAVTGKRPARFVAPVSCVGCEETIPEADAFAAGWRRTTIHTGEADWLCGECRADDANNAWA